jgi:hypothetical protein
MNKAPNHKVHVFLALSMLTVFFSTFLVKPAHILFAHHHLIEQTIGNSDQTTLSTAQDNDCAICDFEFCVFLSASQFNIPKIPLVFADKIVPQTVESIVNHSFPHFHLRAPPLF